MNRVESSGNSPLSCSCRTPARTHGYLGPASDSGKLNGWRGLPLAQSHNQGVCRGFREVSLLCERLNYRDWGKAPPEASMVLSQKYLMR